MLTLMPLVEMEAVHCARTAQSRADEETSSLPTLVLPLRGVFRFHAAGRTTTADPNTVLLFHPDEAYRITHPTDHGDECIAIRYERSVVDEALGRNGDARRSWIPDARTHRALHAAAHGALAAADDLAREESAFALLARLNETPIVLPRARERARLETVREYLAATFMERNSLRVIARAAGFSPYHLARRFRAHTGTSLHQYRIALRLTTAHTMIAAGATDFTRLAHDLGFAGLAHFSTAFRSAYGISPRGATSRPRRRSAARAR